MRGFITFAIYRYRWRVIIFDRIVMSPILYPRLGHQYPHHGDWLDNIAPSLFPVELGRWTAPDFFSDNP